MISYGIDIGTTTLRAVAAEITIGSLGQRTTKLLSTPLCEFTPYLNDRSLNETAICQTLDSWIQKNQLPNPDLGTLLFTGEAQRAANALELSENLLKKWEGLLSAQLNPELESRIAAYGSQAIKLSEENPGRMVVHIDIGGGTSNFAWIENGHVLSTACLNIGARKWILDSDSGRVIHTTREGEYLSQICKTLPPQGSSALCRTMAEFVFDFAGRTDTPRLAPLIVPTGKVELKPFPSPMISISGGIVDCLGLSNLNPFQFGDVGPHFLEALQTIAKERGIKLFFSPASGKATALGIANHAFHVSGSSIHLDEGILFPVRNLPVLNEDELGRRDLPARFAVKMAQEHVHATAIERLAHTFSEKCRDAESVVFLFESNIAKTFGYFLSKCNPRFSALVLDEIQLEKSPLGLQTLDILKPQGENRFLVIAKSLLRF